ncbi:uncharacterized protein LOC128963963 [Oppia nitens]|uniref:uncharacterized protein LOC128963963 n=1 Tax=Oppia nitens TaxID=1686743 RepID=UPI0023DBCB0B|nr:uncharacterized protein LOC128963963 [Oppia nitens]
MRKWLFWEQNKTSDNRIKDRKIVYTNPEFKSLCLDPTFTDMDSSLDGSEILIFKDDKFYVMENLRYGSGTLLASGLTNKLFPNFDDKNFTSMLSIKEGELRGNMFAFYNNQMTSGWRTSGWFTAKTENYQKKTPIKSLPINGFQTVFHNRNINNPLLVGLDGKKVYYYKVVNKTFVMIKQTTNDKSVERLPPDITTSFSMPNGYTYLFRGKQYCVRELYPEEEEEEEDDRQPCKVWLDSRLFLGCFGQYPPPYSLESDRKQELQNFETREQTEYQESLCKDLKITGLTRNVTDLTQLVFRGDHYWVIENFPQNSVAVRHGLIADKWQGFEKTPDSVIFVSEGRHLRGQLIEFNGNSYQQWLNNGSRLVDGHQKFAKTNAILQNLDIHEPIAVAFNDNERGSVLFERLAL